MCVRCHCLLIVSIGILYVTQLTCLSVVGRPEERGSQAPAVHDGAGGGAAAVLIAGTPSCISSSDANLLPLQKEGHTYPLLPSS